MKQYYLENITPYHICHIAVAAVVLLGTPKGWVLYVCWQHKIPASKGYYSFARGRKMRKQAMVYEDIIMEAATTGIDIGGTTEAKKVFGELHSKYAPLPQARQSNLF